MHGDENRAALRVGDGAAVVERRVFVSGACLHDLQALRFKGAADLRDESKRHFAFANASGAAGAGIDSTVSGIEDYDVETRALRCASLRERDGRGSLQRREIVAGSDANGTLRSESAEKRGDE